MIPFVMPETKEQKSRKKSVHPKQLEKEGQAESEDGTLESQANVYQVENVSIEQCAKISRLLGLALEVEDHFSDAWVLEVSSPGLERTFFKLEQMRPYIGHPIDVALNISHQDFENRKKFKGELMEVGQDEFKINFENNIYVIYWENVKRVRLIHVFPESA